MSLVGLQPGHVLWQPEKSPDVAYILLEGEVVVSSDLQVLSHHEQSTATAYSLFHNRAGQAKGGAAVQVATQADQAVSAFASTLQSQNSLVSVPLVSVNVEKSVRKWGSSVKSPESTKSAKTPVVGKVQVGLCALRCS